MSCQKYLTLTFSTSPHSTTGISHFSAIDHDDVYDHYDVDDDFSKGSGKSNILLAVFIFLSNSGMPGMLGPDFWVRPFVYMSHVVYT